MPRRITRQRKSLIVIMNEKSQNLEKTTSSVLSVLLINLWSGCCNTGGPINLRNSKMTVFTPINIIHSKFILKLVLLKLFVF